MPKLAVGGRHPPKTANVLPRVVIADGTVEILKWFGVVLMTLDHVNKYLLGNSLPWAFAAGRLAMPIFGFVLAYNLARPGALASGLYGRTMKRLALYGLAATPFFIGLGGLLAGWWPLNILFTLLVATSVAWMVEQGGFARLVGAATLFLLGGSMVEFWWPAVAFVLTAWWYFKTTNMVAVAVCAVVLAMLFIVNRNLWALAAVPMMLITPLIKLQVPRVRHVFYAYYPAHLAVILLISTLLGKHV
ncbi:conjugal transfer protein TraX [Verminephrobacter aporrectodeae subsp. tuberculatae]|uniref:TraX family protein n=1 Tax=Verminephrobacter aporrectodeae TaxID=1110389 RepID=UPI00224380C8|nr:TraX family protein [Verminephrobacter aporrectodeae]MCW8208091.1 conjugal transfer protein TraX [Verminephrobacter aporrectodeae subsp. tuberculatae]